VRSIAVRSILGLPTAADCHGSRRLHLNDPWHDASDSMGTVAKRWVPGAAAHAICLTLRNLFHDIWIDEILVGKTHGALLLKICESSYIEHGV